MARQGGILGTAALRGRCASAWRAVLPLAVCGLLAYTGHAAAAAPPQHVPIAYPDTWGAVDGLGRVLPDHRQVGGIKKHATVGMFYFLTRVHPGHAIFNNALILEKHPDRVVGPKYTVHWWAEPLFGYYRSADPFVLREHAAMLGDAAVLGVDDDELQCNLAYPPISSIQPGLRQVGRAAAEMLSQLLEGKRTLTSVEISPLRVAVRHSTDITHVEDRNVAAAVRFIRENPMANLSVKVLVHRLATNRRRLERAFLETLGRTPLDEIHRVRVINIKELLLSGKSIEQAAHEMHFSSSKYMSTLFRRATGITPSEYQARLRYPLRANDGNHR